METPNYFAIIPAPVLHDQRLSANDKLLYAHISTLTKKDGFCYAGNRYFEQVTGASNSTVKRMLKNLEDYGYISRELHYREGTKEIENRYIYVNLGRVAGEPTARVENEPTARVAGEPDNSIKENSIKDNISKVVSPPSANLKSFIKWVDNNMVQKWPKRGNPKVIWKAIDNFVKDKGDWSQEQFVDLVKKIKEHMTWYLDPVYQEKRYVVHLHTYFEAEKWLEEKPVNGIADNSGYKTSGRDWNEVQKNMKGL
jgi:DNA-binding MarR family transcriptional regulator